MLFVNRTFLKTCSRISYITLYIFLNFLFPKLSPTFANEYDKNILDRNLITKESTSNSQIKEAPIEYIIGPGDVLYIEKRLPIKTWKYNNKYHN